MERSTSRVKDRDMQEIESSHSISLLSSISSSSLSSRTNNGEPLDIGQHRSTSRPDMTVKQHLSITGVLTRTELSRKGFRFDCSSKKIYLAACLPKQSWSFSDYGYPAADSNGILDLYNSKLQRDLMTQSGKRADICLIRARLGIDDDRTMMSQEMEIELPISPDEAETKLESLKQKQFEAILVGKRGYAKEKAKERNELICQDYFTKGLRMKAIAKNYKVSEGLVSKITTSFINTLEKPTSSNSQTKVDPPSLDDISKFLYTKYKDRGYVALSYNQLEKELWKEFPSLTDWSSGNLRQGLKVLIGLKKTAFSTLPARVQVEDYSALLLGYQ